MDEPRAKGRPDERYVVSLEVFEGPLDLLLHLIRKHEIDVFDIPISFITTKYLEHIDAMQSLDLDQASEYLEMAATLVFIKSRMMVPSSDEGDEELVPPQEGPDPREELVRQLLEYQKYKDAAEKIAGLPRRGRDTFPSGATVEPDGEAKLASPGLYALLEALKRVLERVGESNETEISVTRMSVSARIHQLVDALRASSRIAFLELFERDRTRGDVVVTFLAVLEMTRLGLTRVHQTGPMAEIYIGATESIEDSERVLARNEVES